MGYEEAKINSALRISIGTATTEGDIDHLLKYTTNLIDKIMTNLETLRQKEVESGSKFPIYLDNHSTTQQTLE